jgi:acylphosphatase
VPHFGCGAPHEVFVSDGRDMQRRRVVFRGQVQGVGFRFTTRRIARGHAVTGYVMNLPSGEVELVAEGSADEVARFVAEVEETMRQYIRSVQAETADFTGSFTGFEIRH